MDKAYLLTYLNKEGHTDFAWFDTVNELHEFIREENISRVLDAVRINDYEKIEITVIKS